MPIRLSGLASGLDTESIVSELMSAQRLRKTKIENKKTKAEWKQDQWKELNKKLYAFYTGSLSKMKMQGSFSTKKAESSDASKVSVTAGNNAVEGTHNIKVNSLASAQYVTGSKLGNDVTGSTTLSSLGVGEGNVTITSGTKSKTITISATTTVNEFIAKLKEGGINASFDTSQKRIFLSSKGSGSDGAFSLSAAPELDLSKIGLSSFGSTDSDGSVALSGGGTMTFVSAKNAEFEYNGAAMTSSTNSVTANGLTFNLLGTTGTGSVNINVSGNTKAVYESVKSFVKEYNELITEMNKLFEASSAKGFEPLTDEQKEAMSEDQIDKWESKIKDSLLRRDNALGSLISTMRSSLSQSIIFEGKGYSLSTFGIRTANYTEKGLLHIDGDEEDSSVAAQDNKLMQALEDNPKAVMETLNTLAGKLYTSFSENIKSTSLRSALTFYNDKEIKKQIDDYEDDLKKLEIKLSDIENRYYKQFSAMEKAMSKMNSQSNYLASMLGMNN
jgi:flagellar hook-associated protein 2